MKATVDENEFIELSKQADMRVITMQWRVAVLRGVLFNVYQPWLHGYQGEYRVTYTTGPYLCG